MLTRVTLSIPVLFCAAARADLVTHASSAYGDLQLTVNQHYGTVHSAAGISYSSPGLFDGAAESTAAYGRLWGTASVTAENAAYDINRAHAESAFNDLLTITGSSGIGFVVYEYSIFGSASGEADAHVFLSHGDEPDEELAEEVTEDGVFESTPRSITFGQPFRTGLVLSSVALIGRDETGESAATFEALMTGISVFDAEMEPILSYSVSSESGTQYPLPAPATSLVLAFGGLILHRRRPVR